jgi:hypothetical protein
MTTYRVIDVEHDATGAICALIVKTDTGKRLKNKEALSKETVLAYINQCEDVFYKIDLDTGKTGRVRKDPKKLETIGDKDLADNLD